MMKKFVVIAATAALVTASLSPVASADSYAVRKTLLFGSYYEEADKVACINNPGALLKLVLDEQHYLRDGKIAEFKAHRKETRENFRDYRADCGPLRIKWTRRSPKAAASDAD